MTTVDPRTAFLTVILLSGMPNYTSANEGDRCRELLERITTKVQEATDKCLDRSARMMGELGNSVDDAVAEVHGRVVEKNLREMIEKKGGEQKLKNVLLEEVMSVLGGQPRRTREELAADKCPEIGRAQKLQKEYENLGCKDRFSRKPGQFRGR